MNKLLTDYTLKQSEVFYIPMFCHNQQLKWYRLTNIKLNALFFSAKQANKRVQNSRIETKCSIDETTILVLSLNCLIYAFELYVYLAIDQPDDQKERLATGEDCLSLKFLNSIGKLNDAPCTYSAQGYICEQHSMPLYIIYIIYIIYSY